MTEADDGAGPGARPERQWDVALSFAGGQREYVGQVAATLKQRGVRCFYDADEQVRLWGTHLAEELPRIYARESAAVVVFVSADYAAGDWTRLERRAAFSQAVTQAGVFVLPARFDDSKLPGLLPDVVAIDLRCYSPGQFADLVVAKLADLAISPSPSLGGIGSVPTSGVRVRESRPRDLGVHAAIWVDGAVSELPAYVPRDLDPTLRTALELGGDRGCFLMLVGGSSVGKTRTLYEAVLATLPGWWLIHPGSADEVRALAAAPAPRTVVWLDELQRYLGGTEGLNAGTVRTLTRAGTVLVGTLWPEEYSVRITARQVAGDHSHQRDAELLDLADVFDLAERLTDTEVRHARDLAATDKRLHLALTDQGIGLTQILAAGPELVRRWTQAPTSFSRALITAAVDARRLGVQTPLTQCRGL